MVEGGCDGGIEPMSDAFGDENLCVFNGINGASGSYFTPPMKPDELIKKALGQLIDPAHRPTPDERVAGLTGRPAAPAHLEELEERHEAHAPTFDVRAGIDRYRLEEAGWGVIFAHGVPAAIPDALRELLDFRKSQAGKLYQEFSGPRAYRPGEDHLKFLARHGMGPGQADPAKVPY
jgi:hypothetical protein